MADGSEPACMTMEVNNGKSGLFKISGGLVGTVADTHKAIDIEMDKGFFPWFKEFAVNKMGEMVDPICLPCKLGRYR